MKYKVFCAHHRPSIHRKEYLEQKKIEYNLDFEYVESHEPGSGSFKNPYQINDGELSVSLKYLEILQKAIDENIDFCFIFENDIIIEFDLNVFFNKIISESENVDLVFWGAIPNMIVTNPTPDKIVYTGYKFSRGGHGIMFTNQTCKKILENYDYDFKLPFDITLNYLIPNLNLNCGWTYPHVRQKTAEGIEKSTLR